MFPGQAADGGSHFNRRRDYHPRSGRYLQSDPAGLAGGVNTYAYVDNNPLRFIDPEGLSPVPAGGDGTQIGLGRRLGAAAPPLFGHATHVSAPTGDGCLDPRGREFCMLNTQVGRMCRYVCVPTNRTFVRIMGFDLPGTKTSPCPQVWASD
jgi:RHS repeat-associated protein